MLLNAMVASYYGHFMGYPIVCYSNGFNAILTMFMIMGFWVATEKKMSVMRATFGVITFVGLLGYYTVALAAGERGRVHLGLVLNCTTLALYSSPLAVIQAVIKNKDVSALSFGMAVMSCLCATS